MNNKDTITFEEFKSWLTGLVVGKKGELPDVDDWREIKAMMDRVEPTHKKVEVTENNTGADYGLGKSHWPAPLSGTDSVSAYFDLFTPSWNDEDNVKALAASWAQATTEQYELNFGDQYPMTATIDTGDTPSAITEEELDEIIKAVYDLELTYGSASKKS